MSEELGEAIAAILGLVVGGVLLLTLAPHVNSISIIDLAAMGVLYLIVAVLGTVLVIYGVISSFTR